MMREPDVLLLEPDPIMPNSTLPVLIYRAAIAPKDGKAPGFKDLYHANDWHGVWRNGIYDFHHFHSISHEVLGIEAGRAQVRLGGDTGVSVDVGPGDVLILPAGTGHRRVSASADLRVIGGYPRGQEHPDLLRETSDKALANILAVALPQTDPVQGKDGPLVRLWSR
jgi:uncharacterized protein YjlB